MGLYLIPLIWGSVSKCEMFGVNKLTPRVKVLTMQAWWHEFNPRNPQGGRRELTCESCSLTSTHVPIVSLSNIYSKEVDIENLCKRTFAVKHFKFIHVKEVILLLRLRLNVNVKSSHKSDKNSIPGLWRWLQGQRASAQGELLHKAKQGVAVCICILDCLPVLFVTRSHSISQAALELAM